MPVLTHFVSLQKAGGVETHWAEFVRHAAHFHPEWSHTLLNPERGMHPLIRQRLGTETLPERSEKYRWGLKFPWLRTDNCRRAFRKAGTDIVLIWNRSARSGRLLDAIDPQRRVYWEHGSAWFSDHVDKRALFLQRISTVIANSNAAARMLELRWNYKGEVHVCRNALRPSLQPRQPIHKSPPRQRRVRLGLAGRLLPIKGAVLALHALKLLREKLLDAELHIAGTGPDHERLRDLAVKLNIGPWLHFHGMVSDMQVFYGNIDCLVHPALREPFGLVAIEAAAQGCPVIAAAVDGLPEAVRHGVSGYCIVPRLPLSDYPALGGSLHDVPDIIYDPASDSLTSPRLVDPGMLADTVFELFSAPEKFEQLSRSASAHVLQEFDFGKHVAAVMEIINSVRRKSQ